MTVTTLRPTPIDPHLIQSRSLHERASSLRTQAERLGPVLAVAYRRRASELELESFLVGLQAPVPDGTTGAPAA